MRAAVDIADIVCEDEDIFCIAIVVLHRYFTAQHRLSVLFGEINDVTVECFFSLVEVLNKGPDTILKLEELFFIFSIVPEGNPQPGIEISHLSYSF
ncbi:hypothetical protein ES703_125083 [subsurface metagenome]